MAAIALDWDMADRLRKALRFADVSVADMADYLGVNRNTVGRYINGHGRPDRRTLRLWAIRCGVPLDWLEQGQLPRVDSNHQPADMVRDLETFLTDERLAAGEPRYRATDSDLHAFRKAVPIGRRALPRSADPASSERTVAR